MPVLPHRLNEDWRRVIESIDILDIPGMRAGRQGAEQGKRQSADTIEEQMEIVKRGKVAYLFERYTEEMLIQTLLLLARGGNLEVTAQMKYHIDIWGRARYGEDAWPTQGPRSSCPPCSWASPASTRSSATATSTPTTCSTKRG